MPRLPLMHAFSPPALALRPDVLLERAGTLCRAGHREQARAICRQILLVQPVNVEALNLLGVTLAEDGLPFEAIEQFENVLRITPHALDAWLNRGLALSQLGFLSEALMSFEQIVARQPNNAVAHHPRVITLFRMGRFEEALAIHEQVPELAEMETAANDRGLLLQWSRRADEAMASFDLALTLDPGNADAQFHKGMLMMLKGDLSGGLRLFEARCRQAPLHAYPHSHSSQSWKQPLWLGETSLVGKTIVLYHEQGFGDTLHFCRYALLAARAGARVILHVPSPLKEIMGTLPGVSCIVTESDPLPEHDIRCPMVSLPLAFGTTLETIPAAIPYLFADPSRAAVWCDRLAHVPGPRVGLVWGGASRLGDADAVAADQRRSIPLAALAPLASVESCSFVSLQIGSPADQETPAGMMLHDFTASIEDFADTAALIENLDLIISVDTSVLHLAGAMGKPVWLLNRFDTCWRWFLEREDSPWYPSLRQFRQRESGEWTDVIQRVTQALRAFVHEDGGPAMRD